MKRLGFAAILAVVGLLVNCAPPPQKPATFFSTSSPEAQKQTSRTYAATKNALWSAVLQVVTDNQYPIAVVEKESGILSTDWMIVDSGHPFGGTPLGSNLPPDQLTTLAKLPPTKSLFFEIGIWTKCRYKFSIRTLETTPDSTMVQLTPHIECWEMQQRKDWTPCESTGALESQFFQTLETCLNK